MLEPFFAEWTGRELAAMQVVLAASHRQSVRLNG